MLAKYSPEIENKIAISIGKNKTPRGTYLDKLEHKVRVAIVTRRMQLGRTIRERGIFKRRERKG
jgi:hypothetical protein